MNKKRLYATLFAVSLIIVNSGVAWGQAGTILSPDGLPTGTTKVNNAFGAGESSIISVGTSPTRDIIGPNFPLTPVPNPPFAYTGGVPYDRAYIYPLASSSTLTDIQLGSNERDGVNRPFGNMVIRAYTGQGYALGWISIINEIPLSGVANDASFITVYPPLAGLDANNKPKRFYKSPVGTSPRKVIEFSFNKNNYRNYITSKWVDATFPPHLDLDAAGNATVMTDYGAYSCAPCGRPVFVALSCVDDPNIPGGYVIRVQQHQMGPNDYAETSSAPAPIPEAVYTSTIDGYFTKAWDPSYFGPIGGSDSTRINYPTDDGVHLVQLTGSPMQDAAAMVGQVSLSSAADNTGSLKNYQRPTSVVLPTGDHRLTNLLFEDIRWYFEKNEASIDNDTEHPNAIKYIGKLNRCGSGASTAFSINPYWKKAVDIGQTFVDGAVVLQPDARVCVEKDLKDHTTTRATSHDGTALPNTETDAILAFPNNNPTQGGRFTLRIRGNIDSLNMAQAPTGAPNAFFTQATFPKAAQHIYLYEDRTAAHDFAQPHLGAFVNNRPNAHITNHPIEAPPTQAKAAIFGLYGNYNWVTNNADVHTDTVPNTFTGNVPGVIEVGPQGSGRSHLNVYSGGILKNFEGCMPLNNFTLHFGAGFGTPTLKITGTKPLRILNYGNNDNRTICDANIIFHPAASDTVAHAINGANDPVAPTYYGTITQGRGAMHIQALGNTEFHTDTKWYPGMNNNLLVLSESRNVIAQSIDYRATASDDVAHGLLTLWAEDRVPTSAVVSGCDNAGAADRYGKRGNVYLNNLTKIERTAGGGTETNLVAANNVRTAQVDYKSQNIDTLNVVARKGDLYLGYAAGSNVYNPSEAPIGNGKTGTDNEFKYQGTALTAEVNLRAGFDDAKAQMTQTEGMEGGNVYFTRLAFDMQSAGRRNATISTPYSSEYICHGDNLHRRAGEAMLRYEHSGIIGGLGRCGSESGAGWSAYAGRLENPGSLAALNTMARGAAHRSLDYNGDNGSLILDAGRRGNIILNRGARITASYASGRVIFRTREGDIDLRDPVDITGGVGSGVLLLAQTERLEDLPKIKACGCDEMRNNVYLQDVAYEAANADNSFFIGADNNIKLNYGGLANIGTREDPFLSTDYAELNGRPIRRGVGYAGGVNGGCDRNAYHCDLDPRENKARDLSLTFTDYLASDGIRYPIRSGGFAAVASDRIDVYKSLIYTGGTGSGLASPPTPDGRLHGEHVQGYGLFLKTQANKGNWTENLLLHTPECPTTCGSSSSCGSGQTPRPALHHIARLTFHSDARLRAGNQRLRLESPVIEAFGVLQLDAETSAGQSAEITIRTDSLICHDSLLLAGSSRLKFTTWSGLPGDQPVIKLGFGRRTAPFNEYAVENRRCRECVNHYKGKIYAPGETPLDTMFVKSGPNGGLARQNAMVIDHTVLSFLTDSFDHVKGGDIRHARFFVDTLKIRNQVEFWTDPKHEREGRLELISEKQMFSKDHAGMYTRHLHLEPIGACGNPTSELWLSGAALDVITTSTFGGFGMQYTDVHVENGAHLAPGYTSLRQRGQCYEQQAGTLSMKHLRLDGGANLHFSVGAKQGINGEYSDAIDVDRLTTYGTVNIHIEERPCELMEKRCYPLIYYKSVTPNSLNALRLTKPTMKVHGMELPVYLNISTEGVVYLCVGEEQTMSLSHTVTMPEHPGVTTSPRPGIWPVNSHSSFRFKASFARGERPLMVRTNRRVNGDAYEELAGLRNADGDYEYIVPNIRQEVTLTFGPDHVSNELLPDGATAVWSHGERIYFRVERADVASIYSVAGRLVKRIDLTAGETSVSMPRGAYVVMLRDGAVHKVFVK